MQDAVRRLKALGPMPSEEEGDIYTIRKYEELIPLINQPISDDEARALIGVFGPDECFGLAYGLVHLIETCPAWPLEDCFSGEENEWIERLRNRLANAGIIVRSPSPEA